jgi:hypothetical protein
MPEAVGNAFDGYEKRLFSIYDGKGRKFRDCSIFICRGFKGFEGKLPETY